MSISPVNYYTNSYHVYKNNFAKDKPLANNTTQSTQNNTQTNNVSFGGFFSDLFINKFSTNREKEMYKELKSELQGIDKSKLEILYKTGRLSNRVSNDGSSTIENLYNIYKKPRVEGLDSRKILSETIERLANPLVINQTFGKIPVELGNQIIQAKNNEKSVLNKHPYDPKTLNDLNIEISACCVAASTEFSLADKKPAEFARFVEGLTSPQLSVKKNIKFSSLNKNVSDALYLLKVFNVKPNNVSWDNAEITIAPDRDAIIRARVQSTQYNGKNRSSVDVLLQSAFMQLASQGTYNSLTDKRYGSLCSKDTGLTETEKTFLESVVQNDGEKISVVYQDVDENCVLQGYNHSHDVLQKHLLTALNHKQNVIVGILYFDENKKSLGGHEITIIGYKQKPDGLYFVYNDTDDDQIKLIEEKASVLLPQIHHAGLSAEFVPEEQVAEDNGKVLLNAYENDYKTGKV